jgi:hypothetical protein
MRLTIIIPLVALAALAAPSARAADLLLQRQRQVYAPPPPQPASPMGLIALPFAIAKVGTDAGAGVVTTIVTIPSRVLGIFTGGQ